ncbi:lipid-A-disaccharide synthase [Mariniblastus fucicola]|uniref:Lipid-A-disaccharide synthase n=1 Tax=Mariniblastus fucicola TaxID=980251 RepID=A0A5B9PI05_9BACT|nr:lipid-A-disaccharide synthase [Mariniblastus fucicola]QEG24306.1 Glycosyl transferase [Mariniblastus fucicola]
MRIFFSVGEPSGDLHGSNLIRHLRDANPDFEFVGFGGPKMKAAGCELIYDLTQMAVMFLSKVIANLRFFFGLVDQADDYFANNKVDAVVLIDYPGFNWHIAKKAKARGIPVYYYGVPQVWAWAPWRVRKIRKYVDHVLCKLPFEKKWFEDRKCKATYVGHPYFDQLQSQSWDLQFLKEAGTELMLGKKKLVLLLPGSRDQEVENNLPILIEAADRIAVQQPDTSFAIACYKDEHLAAAQTMLDQRDDASANIKLYSDRTPELMKAATVCMACSGSVSLELLYHRKPTVIVYKLKWMYMVAQSILMRTQFITLTNLMATDDIRKRTWAPSNPDVDQVVMPEYMTTGSPADRMANNVVNWLSNPESMDENVQQLESLARQYAKPGATKRAAEYLLETLGVQSVPIVQDTLAETVPRDAA